MRILVPQILSKAYQKIFANRPNSMDIVFYSAILLFCYFVFNQADILHTAGSSFTYLNGHIKDFYDVNKRLLGETVYLPSTYMLFAAWNIPVKLLGITNQTTMDVGYLIFWYKLLTSLFFFGSSWLMYKIGKLIGLNKANAILLTIIWISSPILFFNQFVFGQYDIFCTFFVLLGMYYFLKKSIWMSILFFGISFTFKYFPVFIFIPLIMLVEKNPRKILLYAILAFLPTVMQVLFYIDSAAFRTGVIEFGATIPRLTTALINVWPGLNIYIFLASWFVICGICYYADIMEDKNKFYQSVFYVCLAVSCFLFTFVLWHPQWLIFITPFLAVTTFMNRKIKEFLFFDFIMMIAFIGFTVTNWQMNADQQMFMLGVLGKCNPRLFDPQTTLRMSKMFILGSNMYLTLFSSMLMLNVLCKFPNKTNRWSGDDNLVKVDTYWNYARLRFIGGIAIFLIPAFVSFFYALRPESPLKNISNSYDTIHNSLKHLAEDTKV